MTTVNPTHKLFRTAVLAPGPQEAMRALEETVVGLGLDHRLRELLKIRASQINGCSFCLNMHTVDARANGEAEHRIYALSAWRDSPFFDPRERAALDLVEHITLIADKHVPDAVMEEAALHFSPDELAAIVWTAVTINAYNRIAITGHATPKPPQ
jgi:AhpD family alkylhydroperoxidase